MVEISADSTEHDVWRRPIRAYFRRGSDRWTLVGLERMTDGASTARSAAGSAPRHGK
jgi:hypothetical protein